MNALHHIELWVPDLAGARAEWGWLLGRLGWSAGDTWDAGSLWTSSDGVYIVVTMPPALEPGAHNRRLPGINHLALCGGSAADLDALVADAPANGWTPLYADRYPHAGGADHYAAYLENTAGFKVEVVRAAAVAVYGAGASAGTSSDAA